MPTIDAFDQESGGWLGEACDIEVLQLGRFDNSIDIVQRQVKAGGQAWYYTSLLPRGRYLNRFVDFPLLKTRLLPWLNYRSRSVDIYTGAAIPGARTLSRSRSWDSTSAHRQRARCRQATRSSPTRGGKRTASILLFA